MLEITLDIRYRKVPFRLQTNTVVKVPVLQVPRIGETLSFGANNPRLPDEVNRMVGWEEVFMLVTDIYHDIPAEGVPSIIAHVYVEGL